MNKNSKPGDVWHDQEGWVSPHRKAVLDSTPLFADLVEHWERKCVALDRLVEDAEETASEETIARLKGKAGMARSMTVELKREIRKANDQDMP